MDYFFDDDDLHFRALIIPDKSKLNHAAFSQDHNTWYYKMYFEMLKTIIFPTQQYQIFIDIKDTRGGKKTQMLHEVLCNNNHDFDRRVIQRIQIVRSEEVRILQLADLLIGAVSYSNRNIGSSPSKLRVVERIKQRSGKLLNRKTSYTESKMNILVWEAS